MRCILNRCTRPAFNLAAEEWLLRRGVQNIFMLWRNAPAVIVGRHQNTLAEIDEDFVRRRGIAVVRRITGGGAVFHDLGNVNFSFVELGARKSRRLDFQRFTIPIQGALRGLGVDCTFDGRNDLVVDGKKFSGNAQHLERDRLLHHGTLLFNSRLDDLAGALRVCPEKFQDRAVKSLPARVTMLRNYLPHLDVENFMTLLMEHMLETLPGKRCDLEKAETAVIEELECAKYASWDWNFGASPQYDFSRRTRTSAGILDVQLDVQGGVIQAAFIRGDFFALRPVEELEALLCGCRHGRDYLFARLKGVDPGDYVQGLKAEEFAECLV